MDIKTYVLPEKIMFPLTTLTFEDLTVFAPNETHELLTKVFGNYMLFPRSGVEHHGSEGDILAERAAKSGTNMDEVLEHLKDIERFFRN